MSYSRLCFIALCACFCFAAHAQSDRDLSGTWKLQTQQSELQASPEPPESVFQLTQTGSSFRVLRVLPGSPTQELRSIATDGRESRGHMGSSTWSNRAKWEGAALLVQTNITSPSGSYSVAERWKLSGNGKRLTIRREIVRRDGETESLLVYERAGEESPTFLTRKDELPKPVSTSENLRESRAEPNDVAPSEEARAVPPPPPPPINVVVPSGTKIPLRLINSVNTKHSAPGDKVYLQTAFPILSHGKVVIPTGSYVTGSLDEVKRAGRVKGKSEFYIRFDSLTLPNGTTRDFRSRMSGMDGDGKGKLDRDEGRVQGDSGKGGDAKTVAGATAAGTSIGVLAGGAAGHLGMGAGIGAAAGALGGLAAVLASRGPDAVLERGSTVEMVLDRDLVFEPREVRP